MHVFERIDGDADFSDFTLRERVVGIHADLGGEIEGDGEAVDTLRQEVAIALIRFNGGAEARVLARGPEAAAVHRGVDAAGERELAWIGELGFRVPAVERVGSDNRLHREAGGRGELAGFEVGEFFCAVSHFDLSDAAGAAKGYEAEDRHHQSVNDCEADQPEDGARLPLAPGCEDAIDRENDEHCAGEFVEDLAGNAR